MLPSWHISSIKRFTTYLYQKNFHDANKEASVFLQEQPSVGGLLFRVVNFEIYYSSFSFFDGSSTHNNVHEPKVLVGIHHACDKLVEDIELEFSKVERELSPVNFSYPSRNTNPFLLLQFLLFLSSFIKIRLDLIQIYSHLIFVILSNEYRSAQRLVDNGMEKLLQAPRSSKWKSLWFGLADELALLKHLIIAGHEIVELNILKASVELANAEAVLRKIKANSPKCDESKLTKFHLHLQPQSRSHSMVQPKINIPILDAAQPLSFPKHSSTDGSIPKNHDSTSPQNDDLSKNTPTSAQTPKVKEKAKLGSWLYSSMNSMLKRPPENMRIVEPPQKAQAQTFYFLLKFVEKFYNFLLVKSLIYFEGNFISLSSSSTSNSLLTDLMNGSKLDHFKFESGSIKSDLNSVDMPIHDHLLKLWDKFPQELSFTNHLETASKLIGAKFIAIIFKPAEDKQFCPTNHNAFESTISSEKFGVAKCAILSFYSYPFYKGETDQNTELLKANRSSSNSRKNLLFNVEMLSPKKLTKTSSFKSSTIFTNTASNPQVESSGVFGGSSRNVITKNSSNSNLESVKRTSTNKPEPSTSQSKNENVTKKSSFLNNFQNTPKQSSSKISSQPNTSQKNDKSTSSNKQLTTLPIFPSNDEIIENAIVPGRIHMYSSVSQPSVADKLYNQPRTLVDWFRQSYLPDIINAVLENEHRLKEDFEKFISSYSVKPLKAQSHIYHLESDLSIKSDISTDPTRHKSSLGDLLHSGPSDGILGDSDPNKNSLYYLYSMQPHFRQEFTAPKTRIEDSVESSESKSLFDQPKPSSITSQDSESSGAVKSSQLDPGSLNRKNSFGNRKNTQNIKLNTSNKKTSYEWLNLSTYFKRPTRVPSQTTQLEGSVDSPSSNYLSSLFKLADWSELDKKKPNSAKLESPAESDSRMIFSEPNEPNTLYLMNRIEKTSFLLVAVADRSMAIRNQDAWFSLVNFVRGGDTFV